MANFGGIIKFRLATGENLAVRGNVSHGPLNFSADSVPNHDGSVDRTVAPKGYTFALSLANHWLDGEPINIAALYAANPTTFSFIHDTEGVIRTFTGAFLKGDPSVDDATGEISGIEGVAAGFVERRA